MSGAESVANRLGGRERARGRQMGEEKGEEIEGGNDMLVQMVQCGDDQRPLFCRTDPIRPLARDSATAAIQNQ